MINGKKYSWEDITITFPHGVMVDVSEIEYSDKKETEAQYGKGATPTGYGEGNYSAEGKAKMKREEFELLKASLVKLGAKSIYKHKPFPITVGYANDDQPTVTDTLKACKITAMSNGPKQGDKSVDVEIELLILGGIDWNGVPGYAEN